MVREFRLPTGIFMPFSGRKSLHKITERLPKEWASRTPRTKTPAAKTVFFTMTPPYNKVLLPDFPADWDMKGKCAESAQGGFWQKCRFFWGVSRRSLGL